MGRMTSAAGEGFGVGVGMGVGQAVGRSASVWWLLPPLAAVYHAAALLGLLSGSVPTVAGVMAAEAGWVALAAAHGSRDGRRDRATVTGATRFGEEQPAMLAAVAGPAGGHEVTLGLCWIVSPLQAAAYTTGYAQAREGITRTDIQAAAYAAKAAQRTRTQRGWAASTPAALAAAAQRGGKSAPAVVPASGHTTTAVSRPTVQPLTASPRPRGAFLGWDQTGAAARANPRGACLVIGPPGTGKSDGVIAPSIATAPGPVLSTTVKFSDVAPTIPARAGRGRVWAFDPGGDEAALPANVAAVHWSPLDSVSDWESALTVAARMKQALPDAQDPRAAHWLDRATDWAAVLLYAASLRGVDELMRWCRRPRAATEQIRAVLESNPGVDAEMAADTLAAVVDDTEERERAGVESTLSRLWAIYKLPGGVRVARDPNFSPDEFVASAGDTLYIVVPTERAAVYAPAVVALVEAVRFAQYRRYAQLSRDGIDSPPVTFVLDEAANTAPIDVPAIASEAGGQRLHLVVALQDLAQARHRWGREKGGGLLTVINTKALLPGIVDNGTIEALSTAIGDYDRATKSATVSSGGQTSITAGLERRRRVSPGDIARIPGGELIVIEGANPRPIAAARWHTEAERIMTA